jgi:hypothetical protein
MVNTIHTINAATATTTGQAIPIDDAKWVNFFFKRSAHSDGSTAFTVEVSHDGTNWVATNQLIRNLANSNAQTLTRVASESLSSNTTVMVGFDPEAFAFVRVVATETTDGTHDAWVSVKR